MEQELEPTLRFSDPIGRVAWHNMAYSPDGEWLAGGVYYECCKYVKRSTRFVRFCGSCNAPNIHLEYHI